MKTGTYTAGGIVKGLTRSKSGQAMIEFAMVAPLFFLLVFGIIDFGRLFFTQMTLQHALREAGRFAVTGRHLQDSNGQDITRVNSIIQTARNAAAGLDVNSISISSTQGGSNSAGGPGDTVTVALTTSLRLITPLIGRYVGNNGLYTFSVRTTFKNEPFPSSQTN
jgi:Flp pilus assembly protein TadG